ncbi:TetR/AcrR family transcriptional regulator [Paenibacillus eucommiae]|uniref:AcrR family transcriptional regulator n=1 Tax=Paenibacillus eucommiae TaxID=1355755 RepID=A0ABS4IU71_9BACL|nr:TetR/AcrR family transcriptional regulator [Paenibacillus eucommiae]MBP1991125.1 AcrR family transcriptional regulator [Paenibacillus eucommiae]
MARPAGQGEQTKKLIAAKAKALFEQKGYSAATMDEICSITGSSKGSIYYHFKNKAALFIYILELSTQEWVDKWVEIEATVHTSTEKLYKLANHFATDFQNPLLKASEEFAGSESADPEVKTRLLELSRLHYPLFQQLLKEGIEHGEFRDVPLDEFTFIVLGLLAGLGISYFDYEYEQMEELYRKAIDLLLQGVQVK